MHYDPDIDKPLHFEDQELSEPMHIRNAIIIDDKIVSTYQDPIDPVTAYASHNRVARERFGVDFGEGGGRKAEAYSRSVSKMLKHKFRYAPVDCICYDKHGNPKKCDPECRHR